MFSHLPQQIVFARHPQCLHNVDYDGAIKLIPNRHSPLTEHGADQAEITVRYLKETFGAFDEVFTSGYTRTHAIPKAARYSFVQSELLNERDQGLMHLLGPGEFFTTFPEEQVKINESYYHYRAPDGENCVDVEARLTRFLLEEQRLLGANSVFISGHGITGRCFRKILTGGTEADWHSWRGLANCSISVYQKISGRFECVSYNHIPWKGQLDDGSGTEA